MKKVVRLTESDFRKVVKKIIQINENEETIPTENNSWQDYVKNFNVGGNFHSYRYIREAAGEVLYEFTIGLKKFLEENGITVLDNSSEPFPELTVSFSYYEDLYKNEIDTEKSLHLNWKNDEEDKILKKIADYYRQHKDKVSSHGLIQGSLSTGVFFDAKDKVKTSSKINEFSSKKNVVKLTESDLARIVKRVINEDKLDNIPRYGTDRIRNIENNGFHETVTFYPKRPGGLAFTIAGKVDAMRMYDELEKNNIDGRVVFGPFFHTGGIEPKSLTVIVDKNDLEKVIDIIKNSNHLGLNPPLQPYSETYYSHS